MRLIYLTIILSFLNLHSQKVYNFDKLLIYNYTKSDQMKDSLNHRETINLINTNDNSYYISLFVKDSLTYTIHFYEHNKSNFRAEISIGDFYKAESITASCENYYEIVGKSVSKKI